MHENNGGEISGAADLEMTRRVLFAERRDRYGVRRIEMIGTGDFV